MVPDIHILGRQLVGQIWYSVALRWPRFCQGLAKLLPSASGSPEPWRTSCAGTAGRNIAKSGVLPRTSSAGYVVLACTSCTARSSALMSRIYFIITCCTQNTRLVVRCVTTYARLLYGIDATHARGGLEKISEGVSKI